MTCNIIEINSPNIITQNILYIDPKTCIFLQNISKCITRDISKLIRILARKLWQKVKQSQAKDKNKFNKTQLDK